MFASSQDKIILKSFEGENIEFKYEFRNLSKLVQMSNADEEIETNIPADTLKVIRKFCEIHEYNPENMEWKSPIKSDKLSENIDKNSYQIMKDYYGLDKGEQLKPLVYAAYHLDFEKFKEICLITMGCPFYIGESEAEIENYKNKWNINDTTPEEERQIIQENKPIFDSVNEVFQQKMMQEEEKYQKYLQEKSSDDENQQ